MKYAIPSAIVLFLAIGTSASFLPAEPGIVPTDRQEQAPSVSPLQPPSGDNGNKEKRENQAEEKKKQEKDNVLTAAKQKAAAENKREQQKKSNDQQRAAIKKKNEDEEKQQKAANLKQSQEQKAAAKKEKSDQESKKKKQSTSVGSSVRLLTAELGLISAETSDRLEGLSIRHYQTKGNNINKHQRVMQVAERLRQEKINVKQGKEREASLKLKRALQTEANQKLIKEQKEDSRKARAAQEAINIQKSFAPPPGR